MLFPSVPQRRRFSASSAESFRPDTSRPATRTGRPTESSFLASDLSILSATAFSTGVLHTILGPDHYVPFVALARSRMWSVRKLITVTVLCGLGHVAGSVVIGTVGLLLGTAVLRLEALESLRGDGAAWLLIGFGLAYFVWGTVQAFRDVPHTHLHAHADGTVHCHLHRHDAEHRHVHDYETMAAADTETPRRSITPWILFLIFVFGPCEVLIPLLMYPAAHASAAAVVLVVAAFTIGTVGTMVSAVLLLVYGIRRVPVPHGHHFGHAAAGLAVLACGALMKLGL